MLAAFTGGYGRLGSSRRPYDAFCRCMVKGRLLQRPARRTLLPSGYCDMSQDPTTSRPGRVPEPSQKNKSPAPEQKRPQQPQSNEEQTWYGLLAFVVIMALFLGGLGITIARSFF